MQASVKEPMLCFACASGQRMACIGKGCPNQHQSNWKAFRGGKMKWDHVHEEDTITRQSPTMPGALKTPGMHVHGHLPPGAW